MLRSLDESAFVFDYNLTFAIGRKDVGRKVTNQNAVLFVHIRHLGLFRQVEARRDAFERMAPGYRPVRNMSHECVMAL